MSRLRIRHGEVRRGGRPVLEAGVIDVPLPAAIAVVGINGSGKSSLFMTLADVLRGRARSQISAAGRPARVAWAPQLPALPGWLTVERTAALYGLDFRRLAATLPGLYLDELTGRRNRALSAGQRQALSIAIAIGMNASVLLLDEPFSALDYRRRLGALDILRARHAGRARSALLVSSQSAADLVGLCDHFVVLRDGRYAFNGPREQLTGGGRDDGIERRLLALLA
ncbi:MAG TPA: ATP-binding cassette domain-containing protein [Longimicrobiales bacterium]|nr:ATP-binding cassette domain-containing protein [Longimicrobiales bacterium]